MLTRTRTLFIARGIMSDLIVITFMDCIKISYKAFHFERRLRSACKLSFDLSVLSKVHKIARHFTSHSLLRIIKSYFFIRIISLCQSLFPSHSLSLAASSVVTNAVILLLEPRYINMLFDFSYNIKKNNELFPY